MKQFLILSFILILSTVAQASAVAYGSSTDVQTDVDADVSVDADAGVYAGSNTATNPAGSSSMQASARASNNRTFQITLSNGVKANIKIMPEVASDIAIARLRLRVCSEENNCTIVLKETGRDEDDDDEDIDEDIDEDDEDEEIRAVYEVRVDKEAKIFGIFRKKMQIRAEIDAETGEVIEIERPWWSGLAVETETKANAAGSARAGY